MAAHYDASKMQASLEAKLICSYVLRRALAKVNNYHMALQELPHHCRSLEDAPKWARARVTGVAPPEGDRALPLAELTLTVTPKSIDRALARAACDAKAAEPMATEVEPEESESGSDLTGVSEDGRKAPQKWTSPTSS